MNHPSDMSPLVSIVMSVYNGATYLREAIESILNQSYIGFEFIIIDDGSIDESQSIIQSFRDKRIVFIKNGENKGLIYSLNKGFEKARGKYIARMDADDVSLPARIEKQVEFMESHSDVGVCSSNYIQFNSGSEKQYSAFISHYQIFSHLFFNSSVIHPTLMIRRSVLINLPVLFDENFKYAEDYELWTRLIFKSRFSSVNEPLLKYRLHHQQVTQKNRNEQMVSANKIRLNMLQRANFKFSDDELKVFCDLGNSQIIKSQSDLLTLQEFLHSLIIQNRATNLIEPNVFEKVVKKHWFDACGLTNLGLKAYFFYLNSVLRTRDNENLGKLLIKCLVRRFK